MGRILACRDLGPVTFERPRHTPLGYLRIVVVPPPAAGSGALMRERPAATQTSEAPADV
jgi:hypothetical protein